MYIENKILIRLRFSSYSLTTIDGKEVGNGKFQTPRGDDSLNVDPVLVCIYVSLNV